jgi:hypothetical protein
MKVLRRGKFGRRCGKFGTPGKDSTGNRPVHRDGLKNGVILRVAVGTAGATPICVRIKLSTLSLVVAVLFTTAAPLLAAVGSHETCAVAMQHHCDKTARLTQCCHDEAGDVSNQPGITERRSNVVADQSSVWILSASIEAPRPAVGSWQVNTSPPHGRSQSLPILFADLRL